MGTRVRRLGGVIAGLFFFAAVGKSADEITAGYIDMYPLYYQSAEGDPAGFAVDVLNRAAQRSDVIIRWKQIPNREVLRSLDSGSVDLIPAGIDTLKRRNRYHVTAPWWYSHLVVLTEVTTPVNPTEPLLLAHGMDLHEDVTRSLGAWTPMRRETRMESLASVCRGEVDGALIDRIALGKTLLERPSPCGLLPLKVSQPLDLPVRMAILSNRETALAADRLRAAIGDMEEEGEMATAALRYPEIVAASGRHVASLVQDRSRTSALRAAVAVLSLLLCVCGWLIYHLRRYVARLSRTAAELQRAYQDLAQFAYASHHDLREPLRNMRLFSQMLQRRGLDDPRAPEHLSYIVDGAERMSSMLDAVRSYTQISPQAEERTVDPADALHEALQKLESRIETCGAEVRSAPMPPVRFDRSHLVDVFFNLIDNSLKYRKEVKPQIDVDAHESNGSVHISVRDNGEGIAPEYQQKVFGVFKRLHGRDVAGTGIGLAICRKIIENHHGRIWIESAPGVGTTVHFTVPRVGRGRSRATKLLPWRWQR